MPVRWFLAALVVVFYLLHQDVWFWRTARPIVFGVLPIGLFYHACYTLAVSALVWVLIRYTWPSHLEHDTPHPNPLPASGERGSIPIGPATGERESIAEPDSLRSPSPRLRGEGRGEGRPR